ncbi:MAG: methyltransferase domain-containing protein [Thiovulaceae bacterium]|nr:methyltransferase domain-containing protein [Sulfurimonadaceae bacterium]
MIKRIKNVLNRLGNSKSCYVCGNTFTYFIPYRESEKISYFTQALQMIGSDIKNFSCPYCWSHDRERHLLMYIDTLDLWKVLKGRVLHFAPEVHLSDKIAALRPEQYVKADLYSNDDDVEKIDITAIPYANNSFDFLICNHVLEHIEDIETALMEIYRVLRKGGMAILQTPYSNLLSNSFQDKNINSDVLRMQFYGQEDHVRVFGHDLFNKLEDVGFQLRVKHHQEILVKIDSKKYGVNVNENLILVEK